MNFILTLYIILSLLIPNALMPSKAQPSLPITGVPHLQHVTKSNVTEAKLKRTVGAWMPYWDEENALRSFRQNKHLLNELSPYLYFVDSNGQLKPAAKFNMRVIEEAKGVGIKVIPMVSNDFDGNKISKIINSGALRKAHINAIVKKVVKGNFDGIDLDYEGLLPKDRQSYAEFIRLLAAGLHKHGKVLSVTLQAKIKEPGNTMATKAQDWTKLGKSADRLRIMAYDYHWKTSPPGPIAPVYWVERIARLAQKTIPAHKVIIAFGTYGYNWGSGGRAKPITIAQAKQLAKAKKQPIRWDIKSLEQYLKLGPGKPKIWLQDSTGLKAKLEIVKKYDFGGVVFWRLGDEDPATWKVVQDNLK